MGWCNSGTPLGPVASAPLNALGSCRVALLVTWHEGAAGGWHPAPGPPFCRPHLSRRPPGLSLGARGCGRRPAPHPRRDAAHRLVQKYEADATASWIHAVLHKIEGDYDNSRYWYRRAGKLDHEADESRGELTLIRQGLSSG